MKIKFKTKADYDYFVSFIDNVDEIKKIKKKYEILEEFVNMRFYNIFRKKLILNEEELFVECTGKKDIDMYKMSSLLTAYFIFKNHKDDNEALEFFTVNFEISRVIEFMIENYFRHNTEMDTFLFEKFNLYGLSEDLATYRRVLSEYSKSEEKTKKENLSLKSSIVTMLKKDKFDFSRYEELEFILEGDYFGLKNLDGKILDLDNTESEIYLYFEKEFFDKSNKESHIYEKLTIFILTVVFVLSSKKIIISDEKLYNYITKHYYMNLLNLNTEIILK